MPSLDLQAYGPAVAALLEDAPLNELGPGAAVARRRSALATLTPEQIVAPHALENRDMALACISALWLRHDFLDESHRISQDLENPTGSFWHGIMHRREPDFHNSKYWFRRVGRHPIFEALNAAAGELAAETEAGPAAEFLRQQTSWDAIKFVDLCELALDDAPPIHTLCMNIQRREWELLFEYCHRQAAGD